MTTRNTVLLIDDNADLISLIARILKIELGPEFTILRASWYEDAIELFELHSEELCLIVCDQELDDRHTGDQFHRRFSHQINTMEGMGMGFVAMSGDWASNKEAVKYYRARHVQMLNKGFDDLSPIIAKKAREWSQALEKVIAADQDFISRLSPAEREIVDEEAREMRAYAAKLPKRFPLKPQGFDQVGSLYRLIPELDEQLNLPGLRGIAITAVLDDGWVEITPVDFDTGELNANHGPLDRLVSGAASPYAATWHKRFGAFVLQRWMSHKVHISVLEPQVRMASTKAANLVHSLTTDIEGDPPMTEQVRQFREAEQAAWERVFQKM